MTNDEIAEQISEVNPEALTADGYEDALLGYVERFGMEPIALYDREKIIKLMVKEGMTGDEAEEFFQFNTIGAWVGEGTPAFATLLRKR